MSALSLLGLIALGLLCSQAVAPNRRLAGQRRLLAVGALILLIALMSAHPFLAPAVAIVGLMASGRLRAETAAPRSGPEPVDTEKVDGQARPESERLRDDAYDALAAVVAVRDEALGSRAVLIEQELRAADEETDAESRVAGYRQALQMARNALGSGRAAE